MGNNFYENESYFEKLDMENCIDPLTKVFNRKTIFEYIEYLIDGKRPFSMLVCDIDNFKYVNDNHGHIVGDVVLEATAASMMKITKSFGVVGRFGGDEFIIVVPEIVEYDSIWKVCRDIVIGCSERTFSELNGSNITLTLGMSRYPLDGENSRTIFEMSDKALYRGKQKGRNCFIIYLESKHANIKRHDSDALIYSSMDMHARVSDMLTHPGRLADNIRDLMQFLSTNLMFDHICLQSPTSKKESVIHTLSYAKSFEMVPSDLIGAIVNSNGVSSTNNIKLLLENGNKKLHDCLEAQGITGMITAEVGCYDKKYGLVRVDATTPNGRIWQNSDLDIIILVAKLLGLLLYYNNTDLDEVYNSGIGISKNVDYDTIRTGYNKFISKAETLVNSVDDNLVFIAIDISNFKYINDFYGLDEGDKVIEEMSSYYFTDESRCLAGYSMGFDQFRGVFDYTGLSKEEFVEYLMEKNKEYEARLRERYPLIYIHVYLGLYFFDDKTVDVRLANDRANLAKKAIKGKYNMDYFIFDDTSSKEHINNMDVINMFMNAKNDDRLLLYIQPKVDVSTMDVCGGEALVRMRSEDGNIIFPGKFVPILEATGLIGMLDEVMVEKVFAYQRKCLDAGNNTYRISVNISRQEFTQKEFFDFIIKMQKKYDVPSSLVEFELLESTFVLDITGIVENIKRLRECGFKISVDDFGAGYSSLNQVANIPADIIKLDGMFARESLKTDRGRAVIKSLLAMLKDIGYDIVFEGVESKEQCELVYSYGCNIIQGFYFSRAIFEEEFTAKYGKDSKMIEG